MLAGVNLVVRSPDDELEFRVDKSYKLTVPTTGNPIYARIKTIYKRFSKGLKFATTTKISLWNNSVWLFCAIFLSSRGMSSVSADTLLMLNTGVRMMINALMNLHDVALLLGYRVRHILFLTMGS